MLLHHRRSSSMIIHQTNPLPPPLSSLLPLLHPHRSRDTGLDPSSNVSVLLGMTSRRLTYQTFVSSTVMMHSSMNFLVFSSKMNPALIKFLQSMDRKRKNGWKNERTDGRMEERKYDGEKQSHIYIFVFKQVKVRSKKK